jgi:hypothetical protein
MQAFLGESITTEDELRKSIARHDQETGDTTTPEEWAREVADMRASVDRDLELLGAYRRLLDVVTMPEPKLEAVM